MEPKSSPQFVIVPSAADLWKFDLAGACLNKPYDFMGPVYLNCAAYRTFEGVESAGGAFV
jgi:hypothetical protein